MFAIGIYGVLARQDLPGKLISLFIMLNAVFVNLAAFNKFVQTDSATGLVFMFFAFIVILTGFYLAAQMIRQLLSATAPAGQNNSADKVQ